jgi:hypothetical protein
MSPAARARFPSSECCQQRDGRWPVDLMHTPMQTVCRICSHSPVTSVQLPHVSDNHEAQSLVARLCMTQLLTLEGLGPGRACAFCCHSHVTHWPSCYVSSWMLQHEKWYARPSLHAHWLAFTLLCRCSTPWMSIVNTWNNSTTEQSSNDLLQPLLSCTHTAQSLHVSLSPKRQCVGVAIVCTAQKINIIAWTSPHWGVHMHITNCCRATRNDQLHPPV